MRTNPAFREYAFTTTVGVVPYAQGEVRFRKGIKQTAFHRLIGQRGKLLKVHNTFLKPYYVEDVLDEYWTMRQVAGLFDVTGEEITEIAGPEAQALMNALVPRDLTKMADGQCLYGIMCYDYGGIVEDAVLIRFSAERFWWVGGLGFSEQWIYGNSIGRDVEVTSLLDRKHIASIQGPKSRDILQSVSDADLGKLPFYHMAETRICGVPVVITRTGYTAELGYEIYVDCDKGETVFGGVWQACQAAGGRLCGSGTLDLRRVEAGLIDFSSDFDWHHTPYQVGLGWMLNMKKGFFHGREALDTEATRNPSRRLAGLRLAGKTAALKGDTVLADGKAIGEITSAVLSPTLDASIAIAMIDSRCTEPGRQIELDMNGERVSGAVVSMPFLDPERKLAKV
jgi:aminomethyltransferase